MRFFLFSPPMRSIGARVRDEIAREKGSGGKADRQGKSVSK